MLLQGFLNLMCKGHLLWDPLKLVGAESGGTHVTKPRVFPYVGAHKCYTWALCTYAIDTWAQY